MYQKVREECKIAPSTCKKLIVSKPNRIKAVINVQKGIKNNAQYKGVVFEADLSIKTKNKI